MANPEKHFPTEGLHSDILEKQFGPVHPQILQHNNILRESLIVDEEGISRTYAITFFPENPNKEIVEVDKAIRSGGMIGKTFREKGFEVRKNVLDVFIIDIPGWLKEKFNIEGNKAKARISEFCAGNDATGQVEVYGTVLEVYTPDFRSPEINEVDLAQINPSVEMFEKMGISKKTVWERLPEASRADEWSDKPDEFKVAIKATEPFIEKTQRRIKKIMNSPH